MAATTQACYNTDPQPCIMKNLGLISNLKRDLFAVSTYPFVLRKKNTKMTLLASPEKLTPDWFSQVFQHLPNESFAIGETGNNSDDTIITGIPPPEQLIFFVLVVLGFFLFLPCGIWFSVCLCKSRKYTR